MKKPFVIYHVGHLVVDAARDPDVRDKAEHYLELGTPLGAFCRPRYGVEDVPRGLGEGHLLQKKLWGGVYEYRYYPKG